jgi:pyruvate/2-oxoglutarate/acetoin dehydrogenase E1 component
LKSPEVLLLGQLVKYGHSSLIRGLEKRFPDQLITYPVCENLMNSSAMGLSLAGKRPIVFHERFDFAMVGMDALVNHIPLWRKKCGVRLSLVMMIVVGHGRGQGPQQNKDFTNWFSSMEGWTVYKLHCAEDSPIIKEAVFSDSPHMIVIPRELYD